MMGFDLSKHRSKWKTADGQKDINRIKLYDTFVNNQVTPLALMCELVKEKGEAVAVALLSGVGTLPEKVTAARIALGRPTKSREVRQPAPVSPQDPEAANKITAQGQVSIKTNADGKWDLTAIAKDRPIEAIVKLINNAIGTADCVIVAQVLVKRLTSDPASAEEKQLGQVISSGLETFYKKVDQEEDEQEEGTAEIAATA
jgi:hypothetical protein